MRCELVDSAHSACLHILCVPGDANGVLGQLLEPRLGLFSVAVIGPELGSEDVIGFAHTGHGAFGVLVESESLRELEEQGGCAYGRTAADFLADGKG